MPISSLPELLDDARRGRYAVGYFESWDVYSLEAVLAAAEAERSPVVIGIGGLSANHQWLGRVGIEIYGAVCAALARRSSVPTAILFNEGESFAEVAGALGAGYNSVMIHTHGWDWDRLIADTAALTAASHELGIAVEGEVGSLAEMTIDGHIDTSLGSMTEVSQAVDFVQQTGVDCLSVAVGNVHFVTDTNFVPQINVERIREIAEAVDVPLVLHGGSGTPPDQMQAAIAAGIAKINVGTRLKHVFGSALKEALASGQDPNVLYGSRLPDDVNSRAAAAVTTDVRRLIKVFGSNGKA